MFFHTKALFTRYFYNVSVNIDGECLVDTNSLGKTYAKNVSFTNIRIVYSYINCNRYTANTKHSIKSARRRPYNNANLQTVLICDV